MVNTSNKKSGPVYSNISLIKKSLVQASNGKLPYHEIVLFLKKVWIKSSANDIDEFVNLALNAPRSFFKEDESGLWELKNQINYTLDPIVKYAKQKLQPFKINEITKLFTNKLSTSELDNFLKSDVRFTQIEGTTFWLLSEWDLINDLIFDYMQENNIPSKKTEELLKEIQNEYDINNSSIVFAPHIDERFSVVKNQILVDIESNGNEHVGNLSIPEEINEEVARKSIKLLNWVENQETEFKIENCIPVIFEIRFHEKAFVLYHQAIENFLISIPGVTKLEQGTWILLKEVPELDLGNLYNITNHVRGSIPTIKNNHELIGETHQEGPIAPAKGDLQNAHQPSNILYAYRYISYYERVKGYLSCPLSLINYIANDKQLGKLKINVEGFIYECWWRKKDDGLYLYGNGIYDFYGDYLIEPGHKMKIEFVEEGLCNVNVIGFDSRYNSEQSRYLDIGKLTEESKKVSKSIFTLMCEFLAIYPSGMHWTKLLDNVNEVRSTTQKTIYSLLSKNECFENLPLKKGYWRLNITKLSRFYIDEEDIRVEENVDQTEENKTENYKITKETVEKDKQFVDPDLYEEEYTLLPLHITFEKWSSNQDSIRYSEASKISKTQKELVEVITKAYSKLLCKYATSRQNYSMEYMDLVQEGFFGLLKAIENYNEVDSFAHYVRTWVFQSLNRYRYDTANLIRIPVHVIEQIERFNKLMDSSLINYGRPPSNEEINNLDIKELAVKNISLHTIDYVSFEQHWGYIYDKSDPLYSTPWNTGEFINYNMFRFYYEKTEDQLKEELSKLCEVGEQNSELYWSSVNVEEEIALKFLSKDIKEILKQLTSREQTVLVLRFGLNDNKDRTLREVGDILGVTRERVRQIESKALRRLSHHTRRKKLYDYYDYTGA